LARGLELPLLHQLIGHVGRAAHVRPVVAGRAALGLCRRQRLGHAPAVARGREAPLGSSQENGKGQEAGVPDSSAHEVPHPWSRRSKLRIPRKWRAVRRGCSYARMRSDATSPRTPSARPVFPSPSCWSATRSISVVSLTVQGYFERWVADKVPPEVRRAQANDYCRHMQGYVLPVLGDMPLEAV